MKLNIENTSWKVLAYVIYTRVAHSFDFWYMWYCVYCIHTETFIILVAFLF